MRGYVAPNDGSALDASAPNMNLDAPDDARNLRVGMDFEMVYKLPEVCACACE